ncbi:MAG: neutral zinc metallopeptidase [Vicinamibacterales bacterium]
MKWEGRAGSDNVEDRRGQGGRRLGLPLGGGIGGIVLLLVISALTGQNPIDLLGTLGGDAGVGIDQSLGTDETGVPPANDAQSQFIRVMLKDTEDAWSEIFARQQATYEPPVLVLFTQATQSGCGLGESAMGPFYCPTDRKVYLDLSFFQELDQRFGAPGDFAQAYVLAHEVGHHVQTLTGLSERVTAARRGSSEAEANALSVRQELQADCYAGVWGRYAAERGLLQPGDAEAGLRAAAAIGDDRLQQQTQGRVVPESFTHGSSDARVMWLRRGLDSGRMDACDTFAGR